MYFLLDFLQEYDSVMKLNIFIIIIQPLPKPGMFSAKFIENSESIWTEKGRCVWGGGSFFCLSLRYLKYELKWNYLPSSSLEEVLVWVCRGSASSTFLGMPESHCIALVRLSYRPAINGKKFSKIKFYYCKLSIMTTI